MVTGQLGKVMTESVQIAMPYVRSYLNEQGEHERMAFLNNSDFFVHFPEGAIKKDGPSAGIAIAATLLSLAKNKPLPSDLGMTGEITLNGKVLPVGGTEVKIMAAKREGLKRIIVPEGNRRDIEQIPKSVKEGLEIYFVSEFPEVVDIVFN